MILIRKTHLWHLLSITPIKEPDSNLGLLNLAQISSFVKYARQHLETRGQAKTKTVFKPFLNGSTCQSRPCSLRTCQVVKGKRTAARIKICRTVFKNASGERGERNENEQLPAILPWNTAHLQKYPLKIPTCSSHLAAIRFLLLLLARNSLALNMQERCTGIDPAAIDNAVLRETHQLLMAMQIVETRELFTVISLWFGKCPCLMRSLTWYIIPLPFKQQPYLSVLGGTKSVREREGERLLFVLNYFQQPHVPSRAKALQHSKSLPETTVVTYWISSTPLIRN